MHDDEIEGVALDGRRVDVALTQLHIAQAGLIEPGAGDGEHGGALVDADGVIGERRDELQHAAGAGAQIERLANALAPQRLENRGFDALLRRVHRANAVPVGGALGEIGGGLLAARFAGHVEPGAVGLQHGIVGADAGDEIARERAMALGKPEERPGPLALSLGQPGVDQQLEMARNARLRLAEDGDELAHRQLGLAEQAEQPQPRNLARRFQRVEQGVETNGIGRWGEGDVSRHKDMFMSIFISWQGASSSPPPARKKRPQHLGRLALAQAAIDFRRVVAGGLGEKPRSVVDRAALGVGRGVVEAADAGVADGAGAHRAGLQRDIEIAIGEPGVSEPARGLADRQHFGMGGGVGIFAGAVAGARDDFAGAGYRRANGRLAARFGGAGFLEGDAQGIVGHGGSDMGPSWAVRIGVPSGATDR